MRSYEWVNPPVKHFPETINVDKAILKAMEAKPGGGGATYCVGQ